MKKTLFVRHAESLANAGGTTQDAQSVPITEKGHLQSEIIAQHFSTAPDLIVTSNYLRTQQTAQPLIYQFPSVRVETWDIVREFTFLDRNQHCNTTTLQRSVYVDKYWLKCDPHYRDGLEEETFFELLARVEETKKRLEKRAEKKIVLFTHGQFMNCFRLMGKVSKPVCNLSVTEIQELMETFKDMRTSFVVHNAQIFTAEELIN